MGRRLVRRQRAGQGRGVYPLGADLVTPRRPAFCNRQHAVPAGCLGSDLGNHGGPDIASREGGAAGGGGSCVIVAMGFGRCM